MSRELFENALREVRRFYEASQELSGFKAFPGDDGLRWQELEPHYINPATLFSEDQSIQSGQFSDALDALLAVKDVALWRETYKDTNIGDDFLNRFGCYELFGWEGHFHCQETRGFIVYSAGELYYPWHHHPAEEMYFILAGEAEFATEGNSPKMLKPGDTVFHAENQPHNMQTREKGVLAWVQWRGDMSVAPVLTDHLNGEL
ncbi:MAG: dimethylsulfonioproprionate lyase family protein [Rhizobiaceae bacterium]|nr:dimethylsulfonioproprionate lyase family protein [Rhizobiaceae bacterium]